MNRLTVPAVLASLLLALAVGAAQACQSERATSARPVSVRINAPAAPRAAQPDARSATPAPAAAPVEDERFRYDSCGCSGA